MANTARSKFGFEFLCFADLAFQIDPQIQICEIISSRAVFSIIHFQARKSGSSQEEIINILCGIAYREEEEEEVRQI